ncbi:MAG: pentapeptide repeat-containing protein, partial [Bacteroidota bacterium]
RKMNTKTLKERWNTPVGKRLIEEFKAGRITVDRHLNEEIKEILIESYKKYKAGNILDFRYLSLPKITLQGFSLAGAQFDYACFDNSQFIKIDFSCTKHLFFSAYSAFFNSCSFFLTTYKQSKLISTTFEDCSFLGSKWEKVDLQSATFKNCRISDTAWYEVDVRNTIFENTGGKFVGESFLFESCCFDKSNLSGITLKTLAAPNTTFNEANLANVDFSNQESKRIQNPYSAKVFLELGDLSNTSFIQADLTNANLSGTNLENANFQDANLKSTNFQNANLKNANLLGADLTDTNFEGADLEGANFKEAWALHIQRKITTYPLHTTQPLRPPHNKWWFLPERIVYAQVENPIVTLKAYEPATLTFVAKTQNAETEEDFYYRITQISTIITDVEEEVVGFELVNGFQVRLPFATQHFPKEMKIVIERKNMVVKER